MLIEKNWQDEQLLELAFTCSNPSISARSNIYVSVDKIEELYALVSRMIIHNGSNCNWISGSFGDETTACVSLDFVSHDHRGHIRIYVTMEIEGLESYSKNKCHLYIDSEEGLLLSFIKNCKALPQYPVGTMISLLNGVTQN